MTQLFPSETISLTKVHCLCNHSKIKIFFFSLSLWRFDEVLLRLELKLSFRLQLKWAYFSTVPAGRVNKNRGVPSCDSRHWWIWSWMCMRRKAAEVLSRPGLSNLLPSLWGMFLNRCCHFVRWTFLLTSVRKVKWFQPFCSAMLSRFGL